ncbi:MULTISPECIES: helical backbone metal receptor [unclassified Cupriavidus]|uniref:helical backbone metal receptor n=1 Tax=unclassified Cupriavidus TaxID=2640874 RepID=UPI001C0059B9|nr:MULTISPECIES: helical backbone metal receptor [unclassified Cupriavidus]MCA3187809.1 ABC transporter substrate-binding protein [Cupriavidus sp.]MCA3190596.1 ABC transporter substrate-binding protein [Cupriavidus sp.]MCA3197301.1 ABC transporter substrate-binding protein [Cupriavidus sp.]MCA3202578.1 ABC transporter substrate-binding protein [Cupriavidus sp.]MCA3209575.1 ABC transporter substrate-binding protein [Cupriavidus sp.]
MWTDAVGQQHGPAEGAVRIASLVPSITELLFDLGLADQIVARTGFCIHPEPAVRAVAKVGGTKDVKLDRLRDLAPTHVIVNIDENRRDTVDEIRRFVPHVIVTHPCRPEDNFGLYAGLGEVFGRQAEAARLSADLRAALDALRARAWPARRVLYAIWQDPWMTVSRDTYISQMLALVNWSTWPDAAPQACVDGDCSRPNAAGERYPTFRWSDALVRDLDAVLLSTEPYRFTEDHADALERQIGKPVLLVDGEMLSWYGSRAVAGARYLKTLAEGF